MKQWIVIPVVFLGGLLVTVPVGLFLGLLLVGPHSDILPQALRALVGLLLWLAVLGVPSWISWIAYRKLKHKRDQ